MKRNLILLTFIGLSLQSCLLSDDAFTDEVNFSGRVVLGYDSNKPIDGVLVEGCTNSILTFGMNPECEKHTFTDSDGYFNLTITASVFSARGLNLRKDGYVYLDSFLVLPDNSREYYMEKLPTTFNIISNSDKFSDFSFDSINYQLTYVDTLGNTKEETINYRVELFINSSSDTLRYWIFDEEQIGLADSQHYSVTVQDNSGASVLGKYFNRSELKTVSDTTIFCKEGEYNRYSMLE